MVGSAAAWWGTSGVSLVYTSISLDQVKANAEYNLSELYDEYMTHDDTNYDNDISPFQYIDSSCDYYTPDQFGIMTNSLQPHNLSAFCINCQSITANWDNFKSLLLNTITDTFAFDIIGITETFKIHSNINYDIPGYHPLQFNTRTGSSSGRGGVGMYIKISNTDLIFLSLFPTVSNPSSLKYKVSTQML